MRILITGGAGFIGSHLTDLALARGDEVVVLDDLSTGRSLNLEPARSAAHGRVRLERGSVLDRARVDALVAGCDLVVHLAAAVGVRLILEQPVRTLETNVQGTRNVLDAATRHGARCLFASSSEVYGRSPDLPFREDGALLLGATSEPRWSYACSKALGEWLALAHAKESGLDVVIVRFFNVVGPRQRGRYGMVLPNFVRQALAGEPITVFGDGSQTRCFLDVADATRAVLALGDEPAAASEVFNVGGTREIPIEELARLVHAELGSSSPIVHMPYREAYGTSITDLPRRLPDTSKLEGLLGLRPSISLEESIRRVAADRTSLDVAERA